MDFTINKYKKLISVLLSTKYRFQTFNDFILEPHKRSVILRHDVDLLPLNSLRFAKIQHENGIKGTYYFRAVPESWDERVIVEISNLGHEIGYHYENLTSCKGNLEKGIQDFEKNLSNLRNLAPVSTICMHGSPRSKFDSKDLWKKYDYKDYGLIGEPYFDVNFDEVFYLTDTGRRWDGHKFSVRDKVRTSFDKTYNSTDKIIEDLELEKLPNQIMFTFHPQRWHKNKINWTKELVFQNAKNSIKKYFFVSK